MEDIIGIQNLAKASKKMHLVLVWTGKQIEKASKIQTTTTTTTTKTKTIGHTA